MCLNCKSSIKPGHGRDVTWARVRFAGDSSLQKPSREHLCSKLFCSAGIFGCAHSGSWTSRLGAMLKVANTLRGTKNSLNGCNSMQCAPVSGLGHTSAQHTQHAVCRKKHHVKMKKRGGSDQPSPQSMHVLALGQASCQPSRHAKWGPGWCLLRQPLREQAMRAP